MDDATVIPLHAADPADPAERSRRAPRRAGRRPAPAPRAADAHVLPLPPAVTDPPADPTADVPVEPTAGGPVDPLGWQGQLGDMLAFLRRRLEGEYHIDEFGFDPDLTEHVAVPALRPLYEKWFRVEVDGVDNIPNTGGALLVANHAGGLWALDSAMTAIAVHVEHPAGRYLRLLGADLVFALPGVRTLVRRTGATLACREDAERLLRAGELVAVWPEGFKGIGKPFRERYKLQRFGRGGFVHEAIKAQVPIIPVSIVGSEEIHPVLGNAQLLARLLKLPYFPITPTFPWLGPLGFVPLPSKWYIEFGAPIHTDRIDVDAADDASVVFELADQVRETIQSSLYRLLLRRRSVWR